MLPRLASLSLLLAGASLVTACGNQIPPRPLPPQEAKAQEPPWFPEEPWNTRSSAEREYFHGKVVFNTGKHTLRAESKKVLQQLLTWLQSHPDISRVRLEGHTDSRATDEYNQSLSERRALEVANWLVDNGLDHNRLLAVAFGETRPMWPNDTSAGRQENRRTGYYVAEVSGRRFRGEEPTNGGLVITVMSKAEREALAKKGEVTKVKPKPVVKERDVFKPYELEKPPINKDDIIEDPDNDPASGGAKDDPEGEGE
jgi:outer membrane protein OmpA-like peptidoglycan-associated protein